MIGPAGHGSDTNMLLVTLGLSIAIENGLLATFRSDTRTLDGDAAFQAVEGAARMAARRSWMPPRWRHHGYGQRPLKGRPVGSGRPSSICSSR